MTTNKVIEVVREREATTVAAGCWAKAPAWQHPISYKVAIEKNGEGGCGAL